MIAVTVRLLAQPQHRAELVRLARDGMLAATRAEPGCISYRFYQDVEDENAFVFVEQWQDWRTLHDHFRSEHFGRFAEALPGLIAGEPEAYFQEVAATRGLDAVDEARGPATPR
jgi:quinol monooxygenase YgiN